MQMQILPRYKIRFTNFGHDAEQRFDSIEAAIEHCRKVCFESTVIDTGTGRVVGTYSPISGWRETLHRV